MTAHHRSPFAIAPGFFRYLQSCYEHVSAIYRTYQPYDQRSGLLVSQKEPDHEANDGSNDTAITALRCALYRNLPNKVSKASSSVRLCTLVREVSPIVTNIRDRVEFRSGGFCVYVRAG
jgi:hypothetical protein